MTQGGQVRSNKADRIPNSFRPPRRLPRPMTSRGIALRMVAMVVLAVPLALGIDAIMFGIATHDGPRMVPSAVTAADEAWWINRFGQLPPAIDRPIDLPSALPGGSGNFFLRRGGHGGDGLSGGTFVPGATAPQSLIAHSIEEHTPLTEHWPLLRGRALSSSDRRTAYRMGSPLPFVASERVYDGYSGSFPPGILEGQWEYHLRPLGLLGNVTVLIMLLGWPLYLRDIRALLRIMRRQCTSCGYALQGLTSNRCPECGCGSLTRVAAARG